EPPPAVGGSRHCETVLLEVGREQLVQAPVVVDEKNARHGSLRRCGGAGRLQRIGGANADFGHVTAEGLTAIFGAVHRMNAQTVPKNGPQSQKRDTPSEEHGSLLTNRGRSPSRSARRACCAAARRARRGSWRARWRPPR